MSRRSFWISFRTTIQCKTKFSFGVSHFSRSMNIFQHVDWHWEIRSILSTFDLCQRNADQTIPISSSIPRRKTDGSLWRKTSDRKEKKTASFVLFLVFCYRRDFPSDFGDLRSNDQQRVLQLFCEWVRSNLNDEVLSIDIFSFDRLFDPRNSSPTIIFAQLANVSASISSFENSILAVKKINQIVQDTHRRLFLSFSCNWSMR